MVIFKGGTGDWRVDNCRMVWHLWHVFRLFIRELQNFFVCLYHVWVEISATEEFCPLVVLHIVVQFCNFLKKIGSFDHFRFLGTKHSFKWKIPTWAIFVSAFPFPFLSQSACPLGRPQQWKWKPSTQHPEYLIARWKK